MQLIQEIRVNWSKKYRSGKAAAVRNAVPEVFDLPASNSPHGYHQTLLFMEETGFEVPKSSMDEFKERVGAGGYWFFECMRTRFEGEDMVVVYAYDPNVGAPRRTAMAREVMKLKPGEWGQIIYNSRSSMKSLTTAGEWRYQKVVFNLCNALAFDPKIFTTTKPKKVFRDMAKLL